METSTTVVNEGALITQLWAILNIAVYCTRAHTYIHTKIKLTEGQSSQKLIKTQTISLSPFPLKLSNFHHGNDSEGVEGLQAPFFNSWKGQQEAGILCAFTAAQATQGPIMWMGKHPSSSVQPFLSQPDLLCTFNSISVQGSLSTHTWAVS